MKQTWEIDNTVTISLVRIDLMHSRGHFTYWVSHLFSNKCIVIYVPICTLKNSSRSEHFSSYPLKQFSCSEFWISGYSILKPLLAILSKSEHFFPILSPMFGRCFFVVETSYSLFSCSKLFASSENTCCFGLQNCLAFIWDTQYILVWKGFELALDNMFVGYSQKIKGREMQIAPILVTQP